MLLTVSLDVRSAIKSPAAKLAQELDEGADGALQLLAAVEEATLAQLAPQRQPAAAPAAPAPAPASAAKGKAGAKADAPAKQQDVQPHGGSGGGGAAAARLRALAQLAGLLQLQLLADPGAFENDLPLGVRRVAAEGLGVEGLPEVEEVEEEDEEKEGDGKGEGEAVPCCCAVAGGAGWCRAAQRAAKCVLLDKPQIWLCVVMRTTAPSPCMTPCRHASTHILMLHMPNPCRPRPTPPPRVACCRRQRQQRRSRARPPRLA